MPEGSSPNDVDADEVVTGGATRAESVRAGLACVPDEATIIVVHDAARPLASPELFRQVIEALDGGCDAVVPGVPVTDTIKIVDDGQVVETLERARLVGVQTPQAFRAGALRRAHASGAEATDDAALIELAGGTVHVIPGEPSNLKITLPADIEHLGRVVTEGHG